MRPDLVATFVVLVVVLVACANDPDLATAERELEAVDGVVDADALFRGGSFKVQDTGTVAVAVGTELEEAKVESLGADVASAFADATADWSGIPRLVVQLDEVADARPFVMFDFGDQDPPPATDVSSYVASRDSLDERELAEELRFVLRASEALGSPVQTSLTADLLLDTTTTLDVAASASADRVVAVAMDPVLVGDDVRWQISGPDLLIVSDIGLSASDAELWKRLVAGTETVPGLRRTQVGLRIEGDEPLAPLRVADLELHTDGRALAAARGATRQLNRLSRQLAPDADPVELWVNVVGPDDAVEQGFPLSGASSWNSFNPNA